MGLKYSKNYKVSFFDVDVTGHMKISSGLNVGLEVSNEQSMKLKRDDKHLMEGYGLTWIILEYSFDIKKLPKYEEEVVISTDPSAYNKFFCYRDITFSDKNGEELFTIHCTLALMDLEKRKIANMTDELLAPFESEKLNNFIRGHKFDKLDDREPVVDKELTVGFWEIDLNGHVNNIVYLAWAIESLPYDFLVENSPKKVYIKYNKEVRGGADILSRLQMNEMTSKHEILSEDENCVQVEVEWEKRESEI